ncbi:MAG: LysR family transcriptional regulator, partial [Alphaproteobacteria bacterium]
LSRIIRVTEEALGVALFSRNAKGVSPTPAGDLLIHRFRRSLHHLVQAENELASLADDASKTIPPLHRLLTRRHLRALIAAAECESVSFASRRLKISPSAIHR